jgi:hypothetical protein
MGMIQVNDPIRPRELILASSLSISRQETERTEQIIQLGFCRAEGIALLPDNR